MHKTLTISMLLLLAGWLLGGCSSDETAPNDPLPELADEDVAHQSGYMAMAVVEMATIALEYSGKADASDGRYAYTFGPSDDLQGTAQLYFEQGGAPSGYENPDYARSWTEDNEPLEFLPITDGVPWQLAFDLESAIDQGAGSAVVDGSGTLTVGDYAATWTVDGYAVVAGADWPSEGVMIFNNDGIVATVTYDGDSTALVVIDDVAWTLDLGDGELTER